MINVKTTRPNIEVRELWKQRMIRDMAISHPGRMVSDMDIDENTMARRSFFNSNYEYWEKKEVLGLFHQWGNDYEEFENNIGNYTVAIVELADGSVVTPTTNDIKFLPSDASGFEEFIRMDQEVVNG
jgi:hypothetical protein